MIIIETQNKLREHIHYLHRDNQCIALVPTMGNLHDGHMMLIEEAKKRSNIVVVTIFVNPIQFDSMEDFVNYPRTLQEDYKKLEKHCVDLVFAPTTCDLYSIGTKTITYVDIPLISIINKKPEHLIHFRGVLTIISKLFNLVQPNIAFFGEKDYQQLILIRRMTIDMNYDIEIVGVPTVRTKDGLALSSRNKYLTHEQRKIAPELNKVINFSKKNLLSRKLNFKEIIFLARQELTKKGFHVENIRIREAGSLLEPNEDTKRIVILIEAWLGKVLLIDNKVLDLQIKN